MFRVGPAKEGDAERHADRTAQDERRKPLPVERVAKLPDRDALHHQPEGDDEGRGLQRRQDMEPDRGGDESEREAREPRDQRGREGGEEKKQDRKIENRFEHDPPFVSSQRPVPSSEAISIRSICAMPPFRAMTFAERLYPTILPRISNIGNGSVAGPSRAFTPVFDARKKLIPAPAKKSQQFQRQKNLSPPEKPPLRFPASRS